jgi:hypothetical protein
MSGRTALNQQRKGRKEEKKDRLTSTTSPEPNAPAHHITLYPNEAGERKKDTNSRASMP